MATAEPLSGRSRRQTFRFGTNTRSARDHPPTIFEQGLQIEMLLFLGGDIGVATGEAIHRSPTTDGADASHNGEIVG